MLVYPKIDPIAIHIGSFGIHWYGLMYLAGFMAFLYLGKLRARRFPERGLTPEMIDDLLTYGVLGVIIGGRLGQVLFYEPGYYFSHPLEIVAVWKGGMSFHGGFLGVLIAVALFARRKDLRFFQITDFIAPLVPLGLMAGRIGNFINGELWGRVADPSLPWSMIFPQVDNQPRHPSQLYEAGLEGLCLFLILWLFTNKNRPLGSVSGLFLIGYGVFRSVSEYFREPDVGIFGHSYVVSMGQWLSLPMIVLGIYFMVRAYRQDRER